MDIQLVGEFYKNSPQLRKALAQSHRRRDKETVTPLGAKAVWFWDKSTSRTGHGGKQDRSGRFQGWPADNIRW